VVLLLKLGEMDVSDEDGVEEVNVVGVCVGDEDGDVVVLVVVLVIVVVSSVK